MLKNIHLLLSKGAYHLSELAARTGPSVNGTHEFWELRKLVLAKLALLMKWDCSVLSALRGTREVSDQIPDGKAICFLCSKGGLPNAFVHWELKN